MKTIIDCGRYRTPERPYGVVILFESDGLAPFNSEHEVIVLTQATEDEAWHTQEALETVGSWRANDCPTLKVMDDPTLAYWVVVTERERYITFGERGSVPRG